MAQTDQDSQYRLITKPAEGKDPWATDYYDFVDTADQELVPQGTIADRDATNPHDGALWYVIDGSDEYLSRYDGGSSSWVKATVSLYKGNDIDSDGDGKVDAADSADTATDATNVTSTYKGNDIDNDGNGTVDSADTAAKVKGNDIDSDGDGVVNKADEASIADQASMANDINNVSWEDTQNVSLLASGETTISANSTTIVSTIVTLSIDEVIIGNVLTDSDSGSIGVPYGDWEDTRGSLGWFVTSFGNNGSDFAVEIENVDGSDRTVSYAFWRVEP